MNEGLNPSVLIPDYDHEFSDKWWIETARMINRGFDIFCRNHPTIFREMKMKDRIHAEVAEAKHLRQRKQREYRKLQEEISPCDLDDAA